MSLPFVLLLAASYALVGCVDREVASRPQTAGTSEASTPMDDSRILILYLTRTGNTEAVARLIQGHVGGRLVPLELETPYPEDYRQTVQQVQDENESGVLPPLTTRIDPDSFDVVFLGFPTWGMQLPPPVKSVLHDTDLSGKTVVPFNTNAGYGVGSAFRTVRELAPDSRVLDGFSVVGGIERDGILFVMEGAKERAADAQIQRWLQGLGFLP